MGLRSCVPLQRPLARYWPICLLAGCVIALTACSPVPRHGTAFLVEFGTNSLEAASTTATQDLDRAAKAMRNRLATAGLRSHVERADPDRLLIKVRTFGSNDVANARQVLSRSGMLEFRMVHLESEQLLAEGLIAPGYEILRLETKDSRGNKRPVPYLIKKKPERGLTGKYMSHAAVTRHAVTDEPQIQFELNGEGAKLFAEITHEYSPHDGKYYQLGIVFDGRLYSAPRIDQPIEGGRGMISGSFDPKEALALANLLENPLDFPPRIVQETSF
jgi:preprotein translocase subunit SecD